MRIVAKIGTSSLTDQLGVIDNEIIDAVCDQLAASAALRPAGACLLVLREAGAALGAAETCFAGAFSGRGISTIFVGTARSPTRVGPDCGTNAAGSGCQSAAWPL